MKGVKNIIKDLAIENNITTHEAEMIVRSQFKMVLTEAQKDTMNPVRLIYLGVFGVKPYRKLKMKENLEKIKAKNTKNK